LVENSIDAGSTAITITVKQGGLDLMQIQDNGSGIRKEDLAIVCERFTTSKLSVFEDLKSIGTFGFRGEALASITHVAHVTITTKTASSPCAYKGKYSDGKLVPIKKGDSAEPKPCAGVNGTTITVEDLFYNMKTRRTAFKNISEQYQRILDVITRYAIHYGDMHISFTCKKHGQSIPDLHTPANPSSSLDNIKIAFGNSLSRELVKLKFDFEFDITEGDGGSAAAVAASALGDSLPCAVSGYVSNANYSTKRSTFIFFINHRLVESSSIKKMLESFYTEILPKTGYPFVYLSIDIPPQIVDVNIHPTKKEVCFLYESQLLTQIYGHMKELLSSANESRVFATQTMLPGFSAPEEMDLGFSTQGNARGSGVSLAAGGGAVRSERATSSNRKVGNSNIENTRVTRLLDDDDDDDNDVDEVVVDRGNRGKRKRQEEEEYRKRQEEEEEEEEEDDIAAAALSGSVSPSQFSRFGGGRRPSGRSESGSRRSADSGGGGGGGGSGKRISQEESTESRARGSGAAAGASSSRASSAAAKAPKAPNKMVRTDPHLARIDQFFPNAAPAPALGEPSQNVEGNLEIESESEAEMTTFDLRPSLDLDGSPTQVAGASALEVGEMASTAASPELPRASTGGGRRGKRAKDDVVLCLPVGSCTCCTFPSNISRYPGSVAAAGDAVAMGHGVVQPPAAMLVRLQPIVDTACQYVSVVELITEMRSNIHPGIDSMLKKFTYVGVVDSVFMLGQVDTKLMMFDYCALSRQLFAQIAIRCFGEHPAIILKNPVNISDFVLEALHLKENDWSEGDGDMNEICSTVVGFLSQKRDLLKEYFSIDVSSEGLYLLSIPELVKGHVPCPLYLPTFLLRLATVVDWDNEKDCFRGIAEELSIFYSRFELDSADSDPESRVLSVGAKTTLQNVFVPAYRQLLIPQRSMVADRTSIIEVTSLEKLYKVFERC
jgi:DNA mismatch repair protein MutL